MPIGSLVDESSISKTPLLGASASRDHLLLDEPLSEISLLPHSDSDAIPFADDPTVPRRSREAQATLDNSASASPAIELHPVSATAVHAPASSPLPTTGNTSPPSKPMAVKTQSHGWVFYVVTVAVLLLAYIRYGITGACAEPPAQVQPWLI